MSVPHSPAELQRLYEKRFAGKSEYRDKVWRVLVDDYFARWIPPHAAVLDLGSPRRERKSNQLGTWQQGPLRATKDGRPDLGARRQAVATEALATGGNRKARV